MTVLLTVVAFALHAASSRYWEESAVLACTGAVVLALAHHRVLESTGRLASVRWMALVSYSFYLLHPLVLGTLRVLMFRPRLEDPVGVIIFFVVGFAFSGIAAHALYRFVERPFMRYRDRAPPGAIMPPKNRSGSLEPIQSNP